MSLGYLEGPLSPAPGLLPSLTHAESYLLVEGGDCSRLPSLSAAPPALLSHPQSEHSIFTAAGCCWGLEEDSPGPVKAGPGGRWEALYGPPLARRLLPLPPQDVQESIGCPGASNEGLVKAFKEALLVAVWPRGAWEDVLFSQDLGLLCVRW